MNRRNAAVADRHALLSSHAYPGSAPTFRSSAIPNYDSHRRTDSPFENPYGHNQAPFHAYGEAGAPKKGPSSNGANYMNLFSGTIGQQNTAADLEEQNDARLNSLSERIKMLKDISTNIGTEVRESTLEMNSLNELFASTGALLGTTFTKMNAMARRQRGWFCNMMLFILLVIWIFAFLWWWRK